MLDKSQYLSNVVIRKGLSFAAFNVDGLRSREEDAKNLLKKTNIDVLTCLESKLDNSILTNRFEVVGYNIIRKDRKARLVNQKSCGGGTIIYYNNTRVSVVELDHKIDFPKECEINVLKILFKFSKPVLFVSVYRRPVPSELSDFLTGLDKLLELYSNFVVIMMGDFNVDCAEKNKQAKQLFRVTERHGLNQMIKEPTRELAILDHVYVSQPTKIVQAESIVFSASDHDLIVTIRKICKDRNPPRLYTSHSLKPDVIDKLNSDISKIPWTHLNTLSNTDNVLQYIKNIVNRIVDDHCPPRKFRVRGESLAVVIC